MTRRDRIEAQIQQTTDRRLLRLLNRESWREFFFPSEQLESNGLTQRQRSQAPQSALMPGATFSAGGNQSCALTAPPEAQ